MERGRSAAVWSPPGPDGEHTSEVLGITLRTVDGELGISWDGGAATV